MTRTRLTICVALLGAAAGASAEVRWTVSAREDGGAKLVSATARNTGTAPARPGRYKLAENALDLGPDAVALVMSGWQGPSGVQKIRGAKPLVSKTLVQLFDGARAWQAGFITFDRVSTEQEIHWDESRRAVIVTSYCDFGDYALAPGAEVTTETLRMESGADPYASLERWADAVAAHYRPPLWHKTPAGWVGWSWVDAFNIERYEDVVLRNARAIRSKLAGFDIEYVWVSLGNLEERRPGNWLRWNRKLFPRGPEALVRELGSLDFKLGLWSGAYWLNSRLTEDIAKLSDAFLLRDGKRITVPSSQWGDSYVLDPTHPKTKQHLTHVFETYRKWGVRYYMIDFLNAIGGPIPGTFVPDSFHDRSLIPGAQTFRQGLETIRKAAGPDTYLLSSTGPTLQGLGLVNAARVGNDYGEGRPLDGPGKGFYPATFIINNPSYWTSHRRATDAWATHFFTHRRLFLADSGNVLTVDKPVPLPDAEISATIFGLNGGPVMLGDDIDRIDPARLEMVKLIFPRLPESARPLDLFESPDPDYPKLFHLRVKREWDEWDLVAAFNYGSEALPQSIDFARLGLDPAETYLVWDFWNSRLAGPHRKNFTAVVPPRSVGLWRVSRQRAHPWLLSTDLHVRQGQAEVESCRWDAAAKTLTIRAQRPAGNRGNVYVTVPKDMSLADPRGLWVAKDAASGTLVVRCDFEFKDGGVVERLLRF